jgi:hypothetical protein
LRRTDAWVASLAKLTLRPTGELVSSTAPLIAAMNRYKASPARCSARSQVGDRHLDFHETEDNLGRRFTSFVS